MYVWIGALILLVASGVSFYRDPRALRVGVLLLASLALFALAAIGTILNRFDDPYDTTAAWILLGMIAIGLVSIVTLALFLLFNGLVMIRRESRSLPNLLSLLLGIALLSYVALSFYAILENQALIAVWILFTVPPVAYVGFVFCAFIMYAWIYELYTRFLGNPPHAVIVLGADLIGARVTPLLASRLRHGQGVYERSRQQGTNTEIVVSGRQGSNEDVTEAEAMARWLIENGVPEDDILLEDRSRNTEQNLLYSRELVKGRNASVPVAVVTSNYHAFRAATLMKKLGLDGYSVGAPTAGYYLPSATIREYIALLRDHFRLNMAILILLCMPVAIFTLITLIRFISG